MSKAIHLISLGAGGAVIAAECQWPVEAGFVKACFANDAEYFKDLHDNWPSAWEQAVNVDDEIRDLSQFGMRDQCFVYAGCISLRELARLGFPELKRPDKKCHTGHCFL